MNSKDKLILEVVNEYKKTLNPKSKWFTSDLNEFRAKLEVMSVSEISEKLSRLRQFSDPKSDLNKKVNKEMNLLYKSGMYEVKNMGVKNSLD